MLREWRWAVAKVIWRTIAAASEKEIKVHQYTHYQYHYLHTILYIRKVAEFDHHSSCSIPNLTKWSSTGRQASLVYMHMMYHFMFMQFIPCWVLNGVKNCTIMYLWLKQVTYWAILYADYSDQWKFPCVPSPVMAIFSDHHDRCIKSLISGMSDIGD